MTINAADSVKVEWTGTGADETITLGAAVLGFQDVPSTFDGLIVSYLIEHKGAGIFERENGRGTYTHSGTTLDRAEVTFSTASNSPVNFSAGTKHISIVLLADDLKAMAAEENAAGNRQNWGQTSLNATSGNVTFDGSDPELIVRVHGHSVARNLTITPAPSGDFSARTLLVFNDGTDDLNVNNHSAETIDIVLEGTLQTFHWASNAWTAGVVLPGGSGGGGGGITAFLEDVAPVDVSAGGTLTAASHGEWYVSGSTLRRRKVRLRHSSNQATAVTVSVEDGLAQQIVVMQAADQTGLCTITVSAGSPTVATINGGGSVALAGPGASVVIIPGPTNVYNVEGQTTEAAVGLVADGILLTGPIFQDEQAAADADVAGDGQWWTLTATPNQAMFTDDAGNDYKLNGGRVITGVSGALTWAIHHNNTLVTSGNVTVPNAAGDVGFQCNIVAGGAHTITFNSLTSAALASGDVATVIVQSTTVIKAARTLAANLMTFS